MADNGQTDGTVESYGKYNVVRYIGKGTFGKVFAVKKKDSEELYALKKIDLNMCDTKDREHAEGEVKMLQQCHHPHLVSYVASFNQEKILCIVMEYCEGGTLKDYISRQKDIDEGLCVSLLVQICEGLKYLHDQNVAHRDIKTTNLFLKEPMTIKIGDFGLARMMDNPNIAKLTKQVGTPYYMSPEMINGKAYTKETDIWSLGCVSYEIAKKTQLFKAENIEKLKDYMTSKTLSEMKIQYSSEMNDLFQDMMQIESSKRPSIEIVLSRLQKHPSQIIPTKSIIKSSDTSPSTPKPPKQVEFTEDLTKKLTITKDRFSQSYPSSLTKAIPKIAREQPKDEVSEVQNSGAVATVKVYMSEEEIELRENVDLFEKKIMKKIGDKTETIDAIKTSIESTKYNDNDKLFMERMKLVLKPDQYEKCETDLQCLWLNGSKLLKKKFRIAKF